MIITHEKQKEIWDEEHRKPSVLVQMDSEEPSGGVVRFLDFIKNKKDLNQLIGLEVACGKGRNVIWLAGQEKIKKMIGFDFSSFAIDTAKERAAKKGVSGKAEFCVGDAVKVWPYKDDHFDFVMDCFGSTDIESVEGRKFVVREVMRTLRPRGLFMVYALSPEDEFHKEMIEKSPAEEKNAFYHTTGKFEKTFDEEELREMYQGFKVLEWQRVNTVTRFFGKEYKCRHFWIILQKT